MRADKLLHQLGLFESRKKAQVAIQKNLVSLKRKDKLLPIKKVSEEFESEPGDEWVILADEEFKYVSRAGHKLAGALDFFKVSVEDSICLDIGLSTGGFTDCLLQRGARFVLGIDAGHGQVHAKLKEDPRLVYYDKINARTLLSPELLTVLPEGSSDFDFMVIDVSFISLLKVLAPQLPLLKKDGAIVALVKPQFEAGPGQLNKKGIIGRAEGLLVLQKTVKDIESLGLHVLSTSESILAGEDGNQEFFIFCRI